MMEWQPIETAPKDGTIIDIWCDRRFPDSYFSETANFGGGNKLMPGWQTSYDDDDNWYSCALKPDEPTHWMPLPKGPNE